MRYVTIIVVVFGIVGCSAISDFGGYTFEQKYDSGAAGAAGAAGGYVPYQGQAGAFWPLAGAGGAAAAPAGQGGMAGHPEPLAGAGGQAGQPEPDAGVEPEPEPEPEPDAGIEPEPDAGISPQVDAGQVEPDAGPVEPDTMQCQPCEVEADCEGEPEEILSCGKVTGDEPTRVCLIWVNWGAGACPYGLVFRGGASSGFCVPPGGDCPAWLDAR
ncbi:MAG: hypothetical protein ACE5F6_00455 [Anaerolineae bacterium]